MLARAKDELGAAAADIEDEQRMAGELRIGGDAVEGPVGFLFSADDLKRKAGGVLDGGAEFGGVAGVARGAGADDADGGGAAGACGADEGGDGGGGFRDGSGLELVGLVKARAEAGLFALFEDRVEFVAAEIDDEEFYGVGADVDDGAAAGARSGGRERRQ